MCNVCIIAKYCNELKIHNAKTMLMSHPVSFKVWPVRFFCIQIILQAQSLKEKLPYVKFLKLSNFTISLIKIYESWHK